METAPVENAAARTDLLHFAARQAHKGRETPRDCQDAWWAGADPLRVAIADGATRSFFAREWAWLLAERFCAPRPGDPPLAPGWEGWERWLGPLREEWRAQVVELTRTSPTPHLLENRLNRKDPATSTFVGVEITPGADGKWRWDALVIGDSCLFHRLDGRWKAEPVSSADQFDNHPEAFLSVAGSSRQTNPRHAWGEASEGDLLVLATDALAKWLLSIPEDGFRAAVLGLLGDAGVADVEADFAARVERARAAREELERLPALEDDDVTLLVVAFGGREAFGGAPLLPRLETPPAYSPSALGTPRAPSPAPAEPEGKIAVSSGLYPVPPAPGPPPVVRDVAASAAPREATPGAGELTEPGQTEPDPPQPWVDPEAELPPGAALEPPGTVTAAGGADERGHPREDGGEGVEGAGGAQQSTPGEGSSAPLYPRVAIAVTQKRRRGGLARIGGHLGSLRARKPDRRTSFALAGWILALIGWGVVFWPVSARGPEDPTPASGTTEAAAGQAPSQSLPVPRTIDLLPARVLRRADSEDAPVVFEVRSAPLKATATPASGWLLVRDTAWVVSRYQGKQYATANGGDVVIGGVGARIRKKIGLEDDLVVGFASAGERFPLVQQKRDSDRVLWFQIEIRGYARAPQ